MRLVLGVVVFGTMLASCGGDEELGPECQAISDGCHEAEEAGDERGIECHDIAHEADEDTCTAEKDACIADCEAAAAPA